MNDSTAQFYFYRGRRLATSINNGERISLFSGIHLPLAEVAGKDASVNSSLYGVDSLDTIQSNRQGEPESYTVYGFAHRSAQYSTLLGFTGQHCQLNGDYLLGRGRRVYSPTLMRFFSPDGLSPFGRGGINAYAYCGGDSVNYSDPLGSNRFWSGVKKFWTRTTGLSKHKKAFKEHRERAASLAKSQGFEAGKEEAINVGYKAGYEEGKAAAYEEWEKALRDDGYYDGGLIGAAKGYGEARAKARIKAGIQEGIQEEEVLSPLQHEFRAGVARRYVKLRSLIDGVPYPHSDLVEEVFLPGNFSGMDKFYVDLRFNAYTAALKGRVVRVSK